MTNITRKLGNGAAALVCAVWALGAQAADFALPATAELTFEDLNDFERYALPVGPWSDGTVPVTPLTGQVVRQAWRFTSSSETTLQRLAPLRQQLTDQGYDILFECADTGCGGFDFRFDIEVLSAPEMYVNLTDFQYLAAVGPMGQRYASLLLSRSEGAGYLQIVQVLPELDAAPDVTGEVAAPVVVTGDMAQALEGQGSVVLSDLTFKTGSSDLGEGPFAALDSLAQYLLDHPDRTIVLVGHTDSVGSPDANLALSRRRAASVMARLTGEYGIPASQVMADGAGFLAPVASNLSEAGRVANRRVEAVLVSTE